MMNLYFTVECHAGCSDCEGTSLAEVDSTHRLIDLECVECQIGYYNYPRVNCYGKSLNNNYITVMIIRSKLYELIERKE